MLFFHESVFEVGFRIVTLNFNIEGNPYLAYDLDREWCVFAHMCVCMCVYGCIYEKKNSLEEKFSLLLHTYS